VLSCIEEIFNRTNNTLLPSTIVEYLHSIKVII
jgi:hypothetical protein